MLPSVKTSQKTSGGLGDLHVDDWQENKGTRVGALHLVSCYFQEIDRGPARLGKQSQYNELSFGIVTRPQNS